MPRPVAAAVAASLAALTISIMSGIANANERPTWNEGDFSGDLFGARK